MSEQTPLEPTVDLAPSGDSRDSVSTPDNDPQLASGGSILQALSASLPSVPRILLREPESFGGSPIVRPSSEEMPSQQDPAARLQLHGEIARGGMGAVLKGRDVDLGRDVAVKLLLEAHHDKNEMIQRFIEEAQISGQLQHPGIAPVYELGRLPDSRPYFTMKLVKGKTLATLLAARKTADEERARFLGIFAQVCQTLAYAHARGVIHRDLKPSNIMVGAFGEVQVMDWGLAKVLNEGGIAGEKKAQQRPEISVIRTQRSDGSSSPEAGSHTQAGTVLGTPAYMAPEQARGEVDLVDERADVFGLGAILCEILTGRPPYVGRSAELQYKARTAKLDDSFARLEACGADAELIALAKHCLAAELWERPLHAGEVAVQVTAYQQSVTERLRQAELARAAEEARAVEARATAVQERKARRMALALAATVLLTVLLGGIGGLWLHGQVAVRLAVNNLTVKEALTQAALLRDQARNAQGRAAVDLTAKAREEARRAEAVVKSGPADSALEKEVRQLLEELDADEKDRQFLDALDAASLAQAEAKGEENRFALERAVPLFRQAFRVYGLAAGEGEATAVAARVSERPAAVREAVLIAVDEWIALAENSTLRVEEPHLAWLRAVQAAAEPEGWGKQLREATAEKELAKRRAALEKVAANTDVEHLPARALERLTRRLYDAQAEVSALALLRRAQLQHSGDFWINELLGIALWRQGQPAEAVRYLTAAVALRPDSAGDHYNLGRVLHDQGKWDEAIAEHKKAIALDPKYAAAHIGLGNALHHQAKGNEAIAEYRKAIDLDPKDTIARFNLGGALLAKDRVDEAVAEYKKAINLDPKSAEGHFNLGTALRGKGRLDDAIAEYKKAIDLDPKFAIAHNDLGAALLNKVRMDEAIAEFRKAVELDPKYAIAHNNLGNALIHNGRLDEAIAEYKKAIEFDPKLTAARSNLGNALRVNGRLDEAITEYKKAIELDPKSAVAHFNLGNALRGKRRFDEAIAEYKKAIELDPKYAQAHNNLGNALWNKGRVDEAIAEHKKATELDPKDANAHGALGHALWTKGCVDEAIAEYKRAIELDPKLVAARNDLAHLELIAALQGQLPAFLEGKYQPRDNAERLLLAQFCIDKKYHRVVAQLYADAFAAEPKRAGDLNAAHRYNAACAAALAGCGRGEDAKQLDDKQRARWRKQALDWLRADLIAYGRLLDGGKTEDRTLVQRRLQHWQRDADLADIRDAKELAKLPADERQVCEKLWADVAALLKKIEAQK